MTGFVFIFFVLMILLGFDILTWGLSLVLLGLASTVITEVLCADPATAAKITDAIIGVLILGFLVYFVIMLFLFPFFGWLLRFASARFRILQFLAPASYRVPRVPPSEQHRWLRWAYWEARHLDRE